VKKLQAEKRLDLLVDIDLKTDYNPLELEEMVQVKNKQTNCHFKKPVDLNNFFIEKRKRKRKRKKR
jgi:hypothetical protein